MTEDPARSRMGHRLLGHGHALASSGVRQLSFALLIIVAYMVAEVVAALASGSLALLADASHLLVDAGALAVGVWAARLAARPAGGMWTFGLRRAEILAAGFNGLVLAVIALAITGEAVWRLMHPEVVTGSVVMGVALAGVLVNLGVTRILAGADRSNLNIRGVFAHVLTDLYAFAGTAAAGLVIVLTGWTRADAIASIGVAALMALAAWGLCRDAGRILLEGAPEQVDLAAVREHLVAVQHVVGVHDVHAWTVTSGLITVSAHVVVEDHCFASGHAPEILDQVQGCLRGHFDLEHSSVQLEPASHAAHERGTHP